MVVVNYTKMAHFFTTLDSKLIIPDEDLIDGTPLFAVTVDKSFGRNAVQRTVGLIEIAKGPVVDIRPGLSEVRT